MPVNPTLKVQVVRATLAIGEVELPGHVTQVAASVAPTVVEYVPAAQSAYTALPVAILYLPVAQEVHPPPSGPVKPTLQVQVVRATLEIGEVELPGHETHVAVSVAPTVVEYVPTAQSVHAAMTVAILYLPASQAVHVPPLGPVNPTLHVQAATAKLAIGELELDGQLVHVALPVAVLYVPATQAVHEPPGPVYPALQSVEMHAVLLELPPTEVVLAGHARQFACIVAPTVEEYFPAA